MLTSSLSQKPVLSVLVLRDFPTHKKALDGKIGSVFRRTKEKCDKLCAQSSTNQSLKYNCYSSIFILQDQWFVLTSFHSQFEINKYCQIAKPN